MGGPNKMILRVKKSEKKKRIYPQLQLGMAEQAGLLIKGKMAFKRKGWCVKEVVLHSTFVYTAVLISIMVRAHD